MAPVSVREATGADLDTVVALRLALLAEHSRNLVYGRMRPDAAERAHRLFARQLASKNEAMFLAEREGEAIGILRCVNSSGSPLLYPDRYGYISSVYVAPGARRSGVLKALLDAATDWCAARGITELRLHHASENDRASRIWESLGFEAVELLRVRPLQT